MVDAKSYVDVNIFVYWLGNHPTYGEAAYKCISRIEESSRRKYVTSSLTLYEALVIIAGLTGRSLRDEQLVESIIDAITGLRGLVIAKLEPEDHVRAVELMKEYGLDYEDSLHLATALRTGAKEIVTNDEDFNTPLKRTFP
ncbi:type II toxin-antitoxin system VapC family toxin [Candidatus Bathyarchaeota archaeon]|nr:type II toxin-antitoxin system VapC family toxin [Candidatus Bathyarchaeota archaeon]MBS7620471.1 type II toxin-antitoxin system VapC family toxin [Candidatus Bathyarchaeota archaeon]